MLDEQKCAGCCEPREKLRKVEKNKKVNHMTPTTLKLDKECQPTRGNHEVHTLFRRFLQS